MSGVGPLPVQGINLLDYWNILTLMIPKADTPFRYVGQNPSRHFSILSHRQLAVAPNRSLSSLCAHSCCLETPRQDSRAYSLPNISLTSHLSLVPTAWRPFNRTVDKIGSKLSLFSRDIIPSPAIEWKTIQLAILHGWLEHHFSTFPRLSRKSTRDLLIGKALTMFTEVRILCMRFVNTVACDHAEVVDWHEEREGEVLLQQTSTCKWVASGCDLEASYLALYACSPPYFSVQGCKYRHPLPVFTTGKASFTPQFLGPYLYCSCYTVALTCGDYRPRPGQHVYYVHSYIEGAWDGGVAGGTGGGGCPRTRHDFQAPNQTVEGSRTLEFSRTRSAPRFLFLPSLPSPTTFHAARENKNPLNLIFSEA
ncbi:hypothetical protein PR048_004617 [Dryococelus australis]|uniref:Uncharacterized protein n=1 Tax=Dryococelus australis TaxID=614101 RepID=A0ABQ9I5Y1_9NEOP|nr:hypothetical protein PR048_004617 [Dryococelus australis]